MKSRGCIRVIDINVGDIIKIDDYFFEICEINRNKLNTIIIFLDNFLCNKMLYYNNGEYVEIYTKY